MDLRGFPVLLLILLGAVAVLAGLSIPVYFAARRPRRGTTEWMRCIETPHFSPLRFQRLYPADLGWLPLAVVLGAGLRLLLLLFRMALRLPAMDAFAELLPYYLLHTTLPCAILAAGMYLLLRLMCGSALAATCGAAAIAVLQNGSLPCAAAVVWALAFLWLWVCAADTEGFALPALWLTLSIACYAYSMLWGARLLWLCPVWIAAWIYVQCRRRSVGRAIASLLLTALLCTLSAAVVCGVWLLQNRYAGQGLAPVATAEFWYGIPLTLNEKLGKVIVLPPFFDTVRVTDALLFLAGGAALICALHGALRRRESECLALLVLIPFFALLWLVGGQYLMTIPLTLALGWLWNLWRRREQTVFVLLSLCILLMTDCVMLLALA